jgi:TonB family protein
MYCQPGPEVYSPREIAEAAGAAEERVVQAAGSANALVAHAEAVRIGRALRRAAAAPPLFSTFGAARHHHRLRQVPLAVSSTLHVGFITGAVLVSSLGLAPPSATALRPDTDRAAPEATHLVFVAEPGPGGGGGGGGLRQKRPPPSARRQGANAFNSPVPAADPPRPIQPTAAPPEPPTPPLNAEPFPVVAAPIVSAPSGREERIGLLQPAHDNTSSRGPGSGGGAGTGSGTGIGEGDGAGVGAGVGGGTGGGLYRPGAGIEPPRIVREVKADYTDDARRRGIEGEVVLEIVVTRDGRVGNVRVVGGPDRGLNERAVQAVRQWRFEPARRLGAPVDVVVEVAVEFRLR